MNCTIYHHGVCLGNIINIVCSYYVEVDKTWCAAYSSLSMNLSYSTANVTRCNSDPG